MTNTFLVPLLLLLSKNGQPRTDKCHAKSESLPMEVSSQLSYEMRLGDFLSTIIKSSSAASFQAGATSYSLCCWEPFEVLSE